MSVSLGLKLLQLASTSTMFYIILDEYRLNRLKRKINSINYRESAKSVVNKLLKQDRVSKIKRKLRKAGEPLGLVPETFIIAKILLTVFAIAYSNIVNMELTQKIGLIIFNFFALDLYIFFSQKDREEAFRRELPIIVDMFELGATADIPMQDTFLMVAEAAENRHVKAEMSKLAAEYFMTNDKEAALNKFVNNIGIVESQILATSLLQGDKTGKTINILESLSSSLYNAVTARLVKQDKSTDYKVLGTVFFLLASIMMLYIYPYFSNIEGGLNNIFL